ncbi:MAG: Na+ dependent nucleoside transporter domain protein, partial [Verrucomicrobiae bacterium]|nr:Na+ dependent nucleoside transporter domain protein [Verrucomicrobiae bacterium]
MMLKLVSLLGVAVFIAVAWLMSPHRKLFPWRTVLWGLALQFAFAVLILETPVGRAVFGFTGAAVQKLVQFSNEGCRFVFGPLADETLLSEKFGPQNAVIFAVLVTG